MLLNLSHRTAPWMLATCLALTGVSAPPTQAAAAPAKAAHVRAKAVSDSATAKPIKVAIVDDSKGKSGGPKNLLLILTPRAGFDAQRVTSKQVQEGVLAKQHFDVVIEPGGSGSGEARRLGETGKNNVRRYVANGGGYVGFCAGSYLASSHYSWSLNLINADVLDTRHWARGTGMITVKFTPAGQRALDYHHLRGRIYYGQGPLLAPGNNPNLPPYQVLGTYATEIAKKGAPHGVMIGATAIARAPYHNGRVFCFSPHPEKKNGLHFLVVNAVRWAAGHGDEDAAPVVASSSSSSSARLSDAVQTPPAHREAKDAARTH